MTTTKFGKTTATFTGIFVLAILLRVFFFEIYAIPSGSMENTLFPGDKVLVNKLVYGPKLPVSPYDIPWVNLVWFLQAGAAANPDSVYWNYRRLPGFLAIERGDVMVFSHPLWGGRHNYFIKRCIALPGDTLTIKDGRIKINEQVSTEPALSKKVYTIWSDTPVQFIRLTDSLGIQSFGRFTRKQHEKDFTEMYLTEIQKDQLLKSGIIDSLKITTSPPDSSRWVYPKTQDFGWTIDNYGPLVIPYKGRAIKLNHRNFLLYGRTISRLEQINLEEKNNLYYLNEKQVTRYVFRKNYYFMLGDNRPNSNDSRYWGFVPEENIVGKASLVLFSNGHDGFNFKRILKPIR